MITKKIIKKFLKNVIFLTSVVFIYMTGGDDHFWDPKTEKNKG